MKRIILLGASGNIGTQAIDLIKDNSSFQLVGISVGYNIEKGLKLLDSFSDIKFFYSILSLDKDIKEKYSNVNFYHGENGLVDLIKQCEYELMINALVGFVGLEPTLIALKQNKKVCLANKESLVVGGELINVFLANDQGEIIPIDSEHVALDKCIRSEDRKIKRLILTASGGAFRNLNREQLKYVSKDDALKHPTWNMGAKITIDCATMMNKCFEIIEAHYLFNKFCDKIDVLIHDESMIHSMIQYSNGIYRAEISKPDMHNAIHYAISERDDIITTYLAKRYREFGPYHFRRLSLKRYPLIKYASAVIEKKGLYGCALNASNEVCVSAFLKGEISFLDIENIINQIMENIIQVDNVNYQLIKSYDSEIRQKTLDLIRKLR